MTDSIKGRFSAVTEKLRQSAAAVSPEVTSTPSRFRRERASEQDNANTKIRPDVEKSEIFKIMTDSALDPKEQAEKIAALLFFNEEDLEANAANIAENQAVIAQLLQDFSDHNRQSIILTRDNPLSELRTGIREVFDEYAKMLSGREDLKDKLVIIDGIITKHGGPEGLIKALLSAKDKENEKAALDQSILDAKSRVDALSGEVRTLDSSSLALQATIADNENDNFLMFKGDKKKQIAEDKRKRAVVDAELTLKRGDMESATGVLSAKSAELQTFITNEDYQVHQQILEILDIGTDEFKQKLTDLSNVTLSYIDNTQSTLEGVSSQLSVMLDRVSNVHTMTQNTVEQVAILQDAQKIAQAHNAMKMQEIESEEASTGVAGMKREKKLRALHTHTTALENTSDLTASIGGELGKVQIGVTTFKDQIQEGLSEAMLQQMMSIASATATGNATLMRIETLATFVQGLVTKGAYKQESEYHLGELAKEMERSLMARMAKNEGIRSIGDVLKEMTDAMTERNDVVLEIAEDKKALIDRLIDQTEKLGKTNEAALAIESEVNRRLYDVTPDDKKPDGQPAAVVPSPLTLG